MCWRAEACWQALLAPSCGITCTLMPSTQGPGTQRPFARKPSGPLWPTQRPFWALTPEMAAVVFCRYTSISYRRPAVLLLGE